MKRMVLVYWRMLGPVAIHSVYSTTLFGISGVLRNTLGALFFSFILKALAEGTNLIQWVILFLLVELVGHTSARIADHVYLRFLNRGCQRIVTVFMEHMLSLPFATLSAKHSGSIISSQRKLESSFHSLFNIFCINFAFAFFETVAVVVVVISQHLLLGVSFSVWIVIYASVAIHYGRRVNMLAEIETEVDRTLSAQIADTLANSTHIVATGTNQYFMNRIRTTSDQFATAEWSVWRLSIQQWSVQSVMEYALLITMVGLCAFLIRQDALSVTFLVALLSYMQRLANSLWTVGRNIADIGQHIGQTTSALDLLDAKPERRGGAIGEISKPHIALTETYFTYQNSSAGLYGINVNIPFGQRVSIVGESGAGKTTLLNLLLGLKNHYTGSAQIGEVEVNQWDLIKLRTCIAIVSQDTPILDGTVYENIAFGLDLDHEDVVHAAQLAHADEFIRDLPMGYESVLGERGIRISGGQRQRIALARAFARGASIIFLDEATSGLDAVTESYIKETLAAIQGSVTIIIVAHRLATVMDSDVVYVMDGGRIVESGNPHELAADPNSRFSEFVRHQRI